MSHAARDVHVRPGARGGPSRQPDRRHHVGDDGRRGRRRSAHGAGVRLVLHPARRRRQRDDPQRDQPRDEGPHRLPRPARALFADFEAHSKTAMEEIVRWATPVIHFRRTATEDTTVGGQDIKAGEKVVMFYNSGNRDERVFDDPFDVRCHPSDAAGTGGFRSRRTALLPRRQPRPAGDDRDVRRDQQAPSALRIVGEPDSCRARSSTASSACRARW